MSGQTPPGWYRDPYGTPGLQRYWDGDQWTQATQPTDEWDEAEPSQVSQPAQPSQPAGSSGSSGSTEPSEPSGGSGTGEPGQPGQPAQPGAAAGAAQYPPPGWSEPAQEHGQGAAPAGWAAPGDPADPARAQPQPPMYPPAGQPEPAPADPAGWAGGWGAGQPPSQEPGGPPPWQGQQGPMTPPPWQSPVGPTTPPPWQAQQGQATPNWQGPPGAGAPPWRDQAGAAGGQPWPPPAAPRPRSNAGLAWGLGAGGGGLLLILIVVVVLFATGVVGGESDSGPSARATSSSPTGGLGNPSSQSPVVGTIVDDDSGLSYPQFGGKWAAQDISASSSYRRLGFTRGEQIEVMANYDGQGNPYLANISSGSLPTAVTYSSTTDLRAAAEQMFNLVEPESYPQHEKSVIESTSRTVSGKTAWYYSVKLSFPQAASEGWNFRTETAVMILIDRGTAKRPAVLYASFPDSHTNLGDLNLVVNSLKAQ